jgi:hypothetical protein
MATKGMTLVGLDVHARQTHAAILDPASGERRVSRLRMPAVEVAAFLAGNTASGDEERSEDPVRAIAMRRGEAAPRRGGRSAQSHGSRSWRAAARSSPSCCWAAARPPGDRRRTDVNVPPESTAPSAGPKARPLSPRDEELLALRLAACLAAACQIHLTPAVWYGTGLGSSLGRAIARMTSGDARSAGIGAAYGMTTSLPTKRLLMNSS